MENKEVADARFEGWIQRLDPLLTAPAVLVLLMAGIYAIGDAVLAPAPISDDPGFVDTVLGSRAVVAAIRLAVIFAGVYVIVSVVALIARGQWLTKVGPVQVSEPASNVKKEVQRLESSLAINTKNIENLERDLASSNHLIDQMRGERKGTG